MVSLSATAPPSYRSDDTHSTIVKTIVNGQIVVDLQLHAKVGIMHAENTPEERRRDAGASGEGFSSDALR